MQQLESAGTGDSLPRSCWPGARRPHLLQIRQCFPSTKYGPLPCGVDRTDDRRFKPLLGSRIQVRVEKLD
jgi:hypothetical protein